MSVQAELAPSAARFQISLRACPEGLDTVLAERGYGRQSLMSLPVASTARVLERAPAGSLRSRRVIASSNSTVLCAAGYALPPEAAYRSSHHAIDPISVTGAQTDTRPAIAGTSAPFTLWYRSQNACC